MCKPVTIIAITTSMLIASHACADGLFFKLPEDGTWVRYEWVKINKSGPTKESRRPRKFTVTISSVGQTTINDEKCRWIEMGSDDGMIIKLLIPEKRLKRGENPLKHVVRGWQKHGDRDIRRFERTGANELAPAYMGGPLDNAKKLDKKVIKSKLGSLMCEGLTGDRVIVNKTSKGDVKVSVVSKFWLHEKAPFGVVAGELELIGFDGKDYGDMKFKVVDFGNGASSALPDSN